MMTHHLTKAAQRFLLQDQPPGHTGLCGFCWVRIWFSFNEPNLSGNSSILPPLVRPGHLYSTVLMPCWAACNGRLEITQPFISTKSEGGLGRIYKKTCWIPFLRKHGSQKWVPPIAPTFQLQAFSTSMILGGRMDDNTALKTKDIVCTMYPVPV